MESVVRRNGIGLRRIWGVAAFAGLSAILIAWICFQVRLDLPIKDFFHEGEYTSALLAAQHAKDYGYPYLPHGMLDIWPAAISQKYCAADALFSCVRLNNAVLTAVSMFLYLGCVLLVVGSRREIRLISVSLVAVLFVAVNGSAADPVALHQGAPSIRDVAILAELLFLIAASRTTERGKGAPAFMILAGLSAALGLVWCYNRGVIGLGLLAAHVFLFGLLRRRFLDAALAGAGLAAGAGLLYLQDPVSYGGHIRNIVYWATLIQGSGGGSGARGIFAGAKTLMLVSVALVCAQAYFLPRWIRSDDKASIEISATLVVLVIGYLKIVFVRPDSSHVIFGLPAVLLLAVLVLRGVPVQQTPLVEGRGLAILAGTAIVVLLCKNTAFWEERKNISANLNYVHQGMPKDRTLLARQDQALSAVVKEAKSNCIYALDNGGAVYALARKPACSAFFIPYYASSATEKAIIADLVRSRPAMIIWSSRRWSVLKDEPTALKRFPRLAAWVAHQYPYVHEVDGAVMRTGASRPPGALP